MVHRLIEIIAKGKVGEGGGKRVHQVVKVVVKSEMGEGCREMFDW